MMLSLAQSLPASLIGTTDKLAKLISNHVAPSLGTAFGFSQAMVGKLTPSSGEKVEKEGTKFEDELWPKVLEAVYAENSQGISSEAILLMQRAEGNAGWSDWGDIDALVPRLAETCRLAGRRLKVQVFWAEKDHMIGNHGTKGPLWFDQCWDTKHRGDMIDYQNTLVPGADHDWIWNMRWGVIQSVFETISPLRGESSSIATAEAT
jgi:hypothetical protein